MSEPWVRDACAKWGRQKRRMWAGGDWYFTSLGEKRRHIDGYAQSFLGRIQDEKVAAGSLGYLRQFWPQVFWGDGLEVQRAIVGMPEQPHACLHLRYVFDPDFGLVARRKAYLIGVPVREYWRFVAAGEQWVCARLSGRDLWLTPIPLKAKAESLSKRSKRTIFRANSDRMAELSLAALNRSVVSLKS